MQRRQLLSFGAAALVFPGSARATYQSIEYQWGMRSDLRDAGQAVIYNFRSSWSLTCQIKEELLGELKAENPAYRQLTFIDVDYDTYGPSQWVERLNVRRRSDFGCHEGRK